MCQPDERRVRRSRTVRMCEHSGCERNRRVSDGDCQERAGEPAIQLVGAARFLAQAQNTGCTSRKYALLARV